VSAQKTIAELRKLRCEELQLANAQADALVTDAIGFQLYRIPSCLRS
jgi:hypothetical protein